MGRDSSGVCGEHRNTCASCYKARQLVTEPAAPPVPVVPPSNAAGWDVSKKLVRDTNGLIVEIAETWRPAAPPA